MEIKTCPLRHETGPLQRECTYARCAWYQENESRCSIWILANVLKKELPKMTDELNEGK